MRRHSYCANTGKTPSRPVPLSCGMGEAGLCEHIEKNSRQARPFMSTADAMDRDTAETLSSSNPRRRGPSKDDVSVFFKFLDTAEGSPCHVGTSIQAELRCLAPLAVQVLQTTSEHAAHSAGRRPGGDLNLEVTKATSGPCTRPLAEVYLAAVDRPQGGQYQLMDKVAGKTCGSPMGICVLYPHHRSALAAVNRDFATFRDRVPGRPKRRARRLQYQTGSRTPPAGPPKALPT
jgi:hypothetical protein